MLMPGLAGVGVCAGQARARARESSRLNGRGQKGGSEGSRETWGALDGGWLAGMKVGGEPELGRDGWTGLGTGERKPAGD